MLIDLHMHEATHSLDSGLKLAEIVSLAQSRGLDAICITDHDSLGLKAAAQDYAERTGFPIFVGVEYYSLEGDIVAFGVEDLPAGRVSAQAFIDYVKARGGICISAHPFRDNDRGLKEHLLTVKGLDGIEAFNASTSFAHNLKALDYCRLLGIQPVGASDCHVREKVGEFATYVPGEPETLAEFIAAFKQGLCFPVGHVNGEYIDLISVADLLAPRKTSA